MEMKEHSLPPGKATSVVFMPLIFRRRRHSSFFILLAFRLVFVAVARSARWTIRPIFKRRPIPSPWSCLRSPRPPKLTGKTTTRTQTASWTSKHLGQKLNSKFFSHQGLHQTHLLAVCRAVVDLFATTEALLASYLFLKKGREIFT